MPTATNQEKLAGLYSAFGRAPDAMGFDYWNSVIAQSVNPGPTIASQFLNEPTFQARYGDLGNQAFVEAIYQNVLGGTGDQAGINFWTEQLESGVDRGSFIANFVDSALTVDLSQSGLTGAELEAAQMRQATITNQATVGLNYVNTLGAASNITSDDASTDPAYLAAQQIIDGVSSSPESVERANMLINQAAGSDNPVEMIIANAATGAISGGAGQTYALTANADVLNGTAGDDTFISASAEALGSFDDIDGSAGIDTLRVAGDQDLTGANFQSIENISIENGGGGTFDLDGLNGVEQVTFVDPDGAYTVEGLSNTQTVGVVGSGDNAVSTDITANVATGTAASLAVNNANVNYTAALSGNQTAAGVSIARVTANGINPSAVTLSSGFGSTQSLFVNGAADLTLNVGDLGSALTDPEDQPATINASAATGDLDVSFGSGANVSGVTLGSGDDTLNAAGLDLGSADLMLNGNAGNDTLMVNDATALITLGGASLSGFETLGFDGLSGTVNASTLNQVGFQQFALTNASGATIDGLSSGSNVVTLEGGGTATLNVTNATANSSDSDSLGFTAIDGGDYNVTASGVETLNVNTRNDDNAFGTATLNITDTALTTLNVSGGEAVSFTANADMTQLSTIDVSGVTAQTDTSGSQFAATVDVSAVDGVAVTGSGSDDSITSGARGTVNAGGGDDTIALANLATATGGAGDDTFSVNDDATALNYGTIADFSTGDILDFSADVTNVSQISLNETATFEDYLSQAAAGDAGEVSWFQFEGNTFVAQENSAPDATDSSVESLVQLTGSVDLSNATTTDGNISIA